MNEVLSEYTDTAGKHHLVISTGNNTGDVIEYVSIDSCPKCGRKFTENMICECGHNNAVIRL